MGIVVFFAFFCFFPFIATVAYAMRLGDGASENDIKTLPKYRYGQLNTSGNLVKMKTGEDHSISQLNSSASVPELALKPDDSVSMTSHFILHYNLFSSLFLSRGSIGINLSTSHKVEVRSAYTPLVGITLSML